MNITETENQGERKNWGMIKYFNNVPTFAKHCIFSEHVDALCKVKQKEQKAQRMQLWCFLAQD